MLRGALAGRLADSRNRRGIRHQLAAVVSVLVAGAASGHQSPLAIAEAAAGWDQELLAAHGCRISPATGLRAAPSARTLYRLPQGLDADGFEAALSGALADAALDPQVTAVAAANRRGSRRAGGEARRSRSRRRRRLPPGAGGRLVPAAPAASVAGPRRDRRSRACPGPPRRGGGRQGAQAREGRREQEGAPARRRHPLPGHRDRAGQGCQVRQGERDQPLQAAAGPAAAGRRRRHQRRDAGEQGQRPVPPRGQARPFPVAGRACFTLLLLLVMACQTVQPGRVRPGYGALCGVRG